MGWHERKGCWLRSGFPYTSLHAIPVTARSSVGAGDSFLAAMVHALAQGWPIESALRLAVSAGAAAVLTPGSDLAMPEDIQRFYHIPAAPSSG